ncbi:MAG: DUF1329 domain-containing protein [bacterium]
MTRIGRARSFLPVAGIILLATGASAHADVSPGDVVDKGSWQKAEGLLPEPVLNWVKKGDFVLDIGESRIDPRQMHPRYLLDSFQSNRDRYDIDAEGGILDRPSGQRAGYILGMPFPDIDPKDPKVVHKLMYNHQYMQHAYGSFRFNFQLIWVGRSGFEREVEAQWQSVSMTCHPGAKDMPNPAGIERYSILLVKTPFDIAGTAIMLWRYLSPTTPDNTFGYVPAIRRVRRMSTANRSDTFIGSDECVDDANGYDGKVTAFDWKLLRVQDAVIPWLDTRIYPFVQNKKGEWTTTTDVKPVIYGYQKEGWTGAPWAPTNLVWVKRPLYVIEMTPKDRYYNYGTHYIWVDPETYATTYKVIYDRSGKYWKTLYMVNFFCQSEDKSMALVAVAGQNIVDERAEHATITENCGPRNVWTMFANVDPNDFSMAGFQKFCK